MPCSRGSSRVAYAASSGLDGHRRVLVISELGVIHDSYKLGSDNANFVSSTGLELIVESLCLVRRHRSDP